MRLLTFWDQAAEHPSLRLVVVVLFENLQVLSVNEELLVVHQRDVHLLYVVVQTQLLQHVYQSFPVVGLRFLVQDLLQIAVA